MTAITWTNERRTLRDLTPWERNPRQIADAQAERLLESFNEFGQVLPICISPAGAIYDGHQRKSVIGAASEYGLDYEVDVRVSSRELTERERQKLTVYLHRGATGDWEWQALAEWEYEDLTAWGFESDELDERFGIEDGSESAGEDTPPQVDKAAELLEKWQVSAGDLWALGDHRLICGDCTDAEVVGRLMDGERAALAPTDPPYNVGFLYDGETVDDKKQADDYEAFTRGWFGVCQSVSEKQIITPGCYNLALWLRWFDAKHWAPWTKTNSMTNGVVSRFWCWEPVLFFGDKWPRQRSNDIFEYPIGMQSGVANHPCPKPLKMWEDLITNYTEESGIVYEPFAGSGTTIIAAHNLNRQCRAVEISPAYCAVILERFFMHSNIKPERIES